MIGGAVDKEVKIAMPLDRAEKAGPFIVDADTKKELLRTKRDSFDQSVAVLQSAPHQVRTRVRTAQLAAALRREVGLTFKSKALRRRFCLGLVDYSTDISLFGLHPFGCRRAVYSYQKTNIGQLDQFLGNFWDVHSMEGQVSFATQVVVSLTASGLLNGSVAVSIL